MLIGLASAVASAGLFGVGAVAQAQAMRALPDGDIGLLGFVRTALRSWALMAVVAAYLLGFALHAVALYLLPLYLAQASVALSLPVTTVVSALWLRERLDAGRWLAVGAVIAGLALVAAGAGPVEHTTPASTLLLVGIGWLLVLALGVRPALVAGAGVLGAWSGLGYAGSAITTRGLNPDDLWVSVLALAVVSALGLVAFWLYSVALRRTDVAESTAPLIVTQTAVPAVVGVLAFGDTVRSGWEIGVLGGLVVSLAGAIQLSRPSNVRMAP